MGIAAYGDLRQMKIVPGIAVGFENYHDACKDSLLQIYFEI
jgi:hypothetical protein